MDTRPAERRRPAAPGLPAPDSFDEQADPASAEVSRGNGRTAYAYGRNRSAPAPFRSLRDDRIEPSEGETARRAPLPDGVDTESAKDFELPADARSPRRTPASQRHDDGYTYAGSEYDPDYDDEAYLPAHGDEFYEEAPRRRLKGWLLAGVAAAAVIVIGVSGLFAYRAIFNVDGTGKPPVTIRPEAGPTKVAPGSETKAADGGNKQIYDRVGGEPAGGGERIVSREERPVTPDRIPQGTPSPSPAGVVTAIPQFNAAPTQAAPTQAAPMSPPPPVSTEPRRVRTVTVRSDGTIVQDAGRVPAAAAPASVARTGPAPASNGPMALQGGAQPAGGQSPALPPSRPGTSGAASDNPWANLSSQGQYATPGTPAQTQAALPPQQPAPAPAIAVSAPPPAGSYVVQVAAQKTEADAQATWQSLQQRFPTILSGQQAQIRRVDLGERGIFYRAQVGPFSSRAQASEVCQSLKAAGGECVIQRN
ncbi:MAG: SPOR domain-containing protein [Bradyrhizobiaceae bacterium]|nr:SPOR domain-containing protein [Bradyrhizobiaceae bacterium]